jgi:hypothetical protein
VTAKAEPARPPIDRHTNLWLAEHIGAEQQAEMGEKTGHAVGFAYVDPDNACNRVAGDRCAPATRIRLPGVARNRRSQH